MKDYGRYVIWLDFFNSELKRSQGRRVPLSLATRAPSIDELGEACRRLSLQPEAQAARYPSHPAQTSGYVSVAKRKPKAVLVLGIAKELTTVRAVAQKKHASPAKVRKR